MSQAIVEARRSLDSALDPLIGTIRRFTGRRDVRAALLLVLFAALLIYPMIDSQNDRVDTAAAAEVFVLLALGLNIVVGFAGLLDLGYAAFFAIGAYTIALLGSPHFSITSHSFNSAFLSFGTNGIHVNFFVLLPIAAIMAAMFGVLFGGPTLRLRGDYLAIVTLGFGEIVPKIIENLGSDNSLGLPNITDGVNRLTGIDRPPDINLANKHVMFTLSDPRPWYYLGLIVVIVSIIIIMSLRDSRLGRAWAAIREDEVAAAHMGINIMRTRLLAFGLGAAFSGFGGVIEASRIGSVDYLEFGFNVSITILVMVVLGGMGSIPGAIIGATIMTYLNISWLGLINDKIHDLGSVLRYGFGPVGSLGRWMYGLDLGNARPLIFGIILVSIMLLRPQGIWPSSTRARELQPATEQILAEENQELYTTREG
jgi:branched-chain amino acid transport system permease protein